MIQLINYCVLSPALAIIDASRAHRHATPFSAMATQRTPVIFKGQRMFDPCFHLWQLVRWENAQTRRYYEARVVKTLFNDWEVFCVWRHRDPTWRLDRDSRHLP